MNQSSSNSTNNQLKNNSLQPTSNIQDYLLDLARWTGDKVQKHFYALNNSLSNRRVLQGEIYGCDLGVNIGDEKNKFRPVLVISKGKINHTSKVIVLAITDAKGKVNQQTNKPNEKYWYLLYSSTNLESNMIYSNRIVPPNDTKYKLYKDSLVQCEEIRIVSKSRLNFKNGPIDKLSTVDLEQIIKRISIVL